MHHFHPNAVSLEAHYLIAHNPVVEDQLWSHALQLLAAMHAVHLAGGALRQLDAAHVLLTDKSTVRVTDAATLDILRAIAIGSGPENAVLALGYAGWGAGQLESEIQSNGWLHCAADPALLFDDGIATKYNRALGKIGIDPAFLSREAGHA